MFSLIVLKYSWPRMLILYAIKWHELFYFCIDSNICLFTYDLNIGWNFSQGDPFCIAPQVCLYFIDDPLKRLLNLEHEPAKFLF